MFVGRSLSIKTAFHFAKWYSYMVLMLSAFHMCRTWKNGWNPDTKLWTWMVRQATQIIRGVHEALFWGCDLLSVVAPHPVILSTRLGTPGALCTLLLSPFYGPPLCDWTRCRLRALSGGGGSGGSGGGSSCAVASPPLSPALPKYKLAEFRYGREEMLALYVKDNKVGGAVVSE